MASNTLVILNQVIAKIWQNRQIWYVSDGVMLRRKSMQINRVQSMKESTPVINDYFVITIASGETIVKKKKEKRIKLAEDISQLLTR